MEYDSFHVANKALDLAQKNNYIKGIADSYYHISLFEVADSVKLISGSPLRQLNKSIEYYKEVDNVDSELFLAIVNYADLLLENPATKNKALSFLLDQRVFFPTSVVEQGKLNIKIGEVYESMDTNISTTNDNLEKALEYYRKSNIIFRKIKAVASLNEGLKKEAICLVKLNQEEKVTFLGESILSLAIPIEDKFETLNNIAQIYQEKNNKEALSFFKEMEKIISPDSSFQLGQLQAKISQSLLSDGQTDKAIELAQNVVNAIQAPLSTPNKNDFYTLKIVHNVLAQAHKKNKNYEAALANHEQYLISSNIAYDQEINRDRVVRNKEKERITALEIANIEKEQNLLLEKKSNRRQLIIVALLFSFIGITFLAKYLHTQKSNLDKIRVMDQKIFSQKLNQVEQEKEIQAINAELEGQHTERKRIAKDLHDNLGALLSVTKLHLSNINSENRSSIEKATEALDKAHQEMRNISHEMMPGVLIELGLIPAIESLCEEITISGKLNISCYSYGEAKKLDDKSQTSIYFIISELINNIIKHAQAKTASIQINFFDEELNIMVEDNGIGFDITKVLKNKSKDLQTVKSRIKHLQGKFAIDSSLGNGTTITIDLPL